MTLNLYLDCVSSKGQKGAGPFITLKTKSKILNSILKWTGSQCKKSRTGIICSYLQVPVRSLEAAFCTVWRRFIYDWLIPIYIELQESSWDEIKAGITLSNSAQVKKPFTLARSLSWKKNSIWLLHLLIKSQSRVKQHPIFLQRAWHTARSPRTFCILRDTAKDIFVLNLALHFIG